MGLSRGLVGMPEAIEESLPELLHVVVGDCGLRQQPSLEQPQSFGTDGGAAGSQVLDESRAGSDGVEDESFRFLFELSGSLLHCETQRSNKKPIDRGIWKIEVCFVRRRRNGKLMRKAEKP